MERNLYVIHSILLMLILSAVSTSIGIQNNAIASSTEGEEEPAPVTPPTGFGSTAPPPAPAPATATTTLTPNATAGALNASEFVRTAVMLFGVKPNTPDVVTWVNLPRENITGGEIANAERLEASNNITTDEIGVLFITIPNSTNQLNQQIEACAMDIVSRIPSCDNAFQSNVSRATLLQILLPDQAARDAAAAGIGGTGSFVTGPRQ